MGRCNRIAWFRGFRPGNVTVDVPVGLGKDREGVQRCLSKFLTPEVVDTSSKKTRKILEADACRGG